MVENATIGALRVVLGADTAAFETGLKKAESTLASFGLNINKIVGGLTIAGVVTGIAVAFKSAVDHADELGKAAQKVGAPVEELSKLEYAANLSGLKLDDLVGSLGKLEKNLSLAAGGSDEAKKGFQALGLSADDLVKRPLSDVVATMAGKFENLGESITKPAVAIEVFGKAGQGMLPLLNSGAQGLREMYQEAEQLGLVITDKTYKAAEAFNDNLTRLGKVKEGLANIIMAQLIPALTFFTGALVTAAKESGLLRDAGDKAKVAMEGMVAVAVTASVVYDRLGITLNAFNDLMQKQVTVKTDTPDWLKSLTDRLWSWNDSLHAILPTQKDWNDLLSGTGVEASTLAAAAEKAVPGIGVFLEVLKGNKEAFSDLPAKIQATIDAINKAGDTALKTAPKMDAPVIPAKNFQKALDDIRIKTIELQGGFSNLAPGFVAQAVSLNILDATHVKFGQTLTATTAQQIALNNALMTFRGAQITEENLLPWDKLNLQLTQLNTVLASGQISFDTYQRAAKKAADAAGMSFTVASMSISQSFVDIANSVGGPTSKIVRIAQVAAAATALVNILSAQAYALAGPFPANLVAFAAVAAKGAALVAAIRAASTTPQMAGGGSFTVPGGTSGIDNRMVAMSLAAGERVDVTPAGKGGEVRVVRIEGLDRPRYTLDEVKGILDVAGQAMRDGYRFEVAR